MNDRSGIGKHGGGAMSVATVSSLTDADIERPEISRSRAKDADDRRPMTAGSDRVDAPGAAADKVWLKQYPPGVPRDIGSLGYSSLIELFEDSCRRFRDLPALSNMGTVMTYAELDRKSRHFAAYLQASRGMHPGDRLAIMLPNILQYPVVLFGALRAGLVIVNCNPLYTARELEHQLRDSGATAIVVFENAAHVVQEVIGKTALRSVIVTAIGDMFPPIKAWATNLVVKYVKRMVVPWQIDGAVKFKAALIEGEQLALVPGVARPKRYRLPSIHRWHYRCSEGCDVDPREHDRESAADLRLDRAGAAGRQGNRRDGVAALSRLRVDGQPADVFQVGRKECADHEPTRRSPDSSTRLRTLRFTVITGVNTLFKAMMNDPDMRKVDTKRTQGRGGGRNGRAAGCCPEVDGAHRQTFDRRLRAHREHRL